MAASDSSRLVVWFDRTACEKDNQPIREFFEANIGPVILLNDTIEWKRFLGRNIHKKRLFVIITGQLGKDFIPEIHDLPYITSIYIYCQQQEFHKQWSQPYTKVEAQ